jgi:hypothetical protein
MPAKAPVSVALIGGMSSAAAWTALHYLTPPGASVLLGQTATPPLAVMTSGGGHIAFAGLHVPMAAEGSHTFVVAGTHGDIAAVSSTQWAVTPYLLLSTYSSLPERPVAVSGQESEASTKAGERRLLNEAWS